MAVEVVKKAHIIVKTRKGKHTALFTKWLNQVITLREEEALKITLDDKSPHIVTIQDAVKRWNQIHREKKIKCICRDTHTDSPVVYLFWGGGVK